MLSPKMQRPFRINEGHIIALAQEAFKQPAYAGFLHKRSGESNKWQYRWFVLYQVSNDN